MVASEPVPAVVGTAIKSGSGRRTFRSPPSWATVLSGRTTRAAATFAASMGEPPPRTRKLSQPSARYCAASFSTVATLGSDSTPEKTDGRTPRPSSAARRARKRSSAHWRRLATTRGREAPSREKTSGSFSRLPAPLRTVGVRHGRSRAPRAKPHWKARQGRVWSGVGRPHFRRRWIYHKGG